LRLPHGVLTASTITAVFICVSLVGFTCFKRDLSLPYLLTDSAIGLPITNLSLNWAKVQGQLS